MKWRALMADANTDQTMGGNLPAEAGFGDFGRKKEKKRHERLIRVYTVTLWKPEKPPCKSVPPRLLLVA